MSQWSWGRGLNLSTKGSLRTSLYSQYTNLNASSEMGTRVAFAFYSQRPIKVLASELGVHIFEEQDTSSPVMRCQSHGRKDIVPSIEVDHG